METFISREPEEKRQRKMTSLDPVTCPVCGITIRENELDQHFKSELEKLGKIKKIVNKSPSSTPPGTSKNKPGESSSSSRKDSEENCWDTYQKIKENRVRRSSKVNKLLLNLSASALITILTLIPIYSSKIAREKQKIDHVQFAPRLSARTYKFT